MTNTWQWDAVHARGQTLFGDTPGAQLEQRIIVHFQSTPNRVVDLIEHIGRRIAKGANIHSGWAILATELDKQPRDATAADTGEQAKQIALAEAWLRNTGGYLDRPDELDDELFGHRGRLRHWPELKPRMVALWQEQRPRFEQAEQEHLERSLNQTTLRERTRPRKQCRYCGKTHRSDTDACKEHRPLLTEDHRFDLAYYDTIEHPEGEAA